MSTRYEVDYIVQVVDQNASGTLNTLTTAFAKLGPSIQIVDRLNKRMTGLANQILRINHTRITDLASSFNNLGNAVQITDRLNRRLRQLNHNLNSGSRRLIIDTSSASTALSNIQSQIDNIRSSLSSLGAMPGGAGRSTASHNTSTPRSFFKSGNHMYARGNSRPSEALLDKGLMWTRTNIPLNAFTNKELESYDKLLKRKVHQENKLNQRLSHWKSGAGTWRAGSADLTPQEYLNQVNAGLLAPTNAAVKTAKSIVAQQKSLDKTVRAVNGYTKGYVATAKQSNIPVKIRTASGGPNTASGAPAAASASQRAFGQTPFTSNGGMAVNMLKGMGIAYGISGIGSFMSNIFNESAEYENLMSTVGNILKSNESKAGFSGRYNLMERVIRDVGIRTKYKVTEVADAAKFLAMAGLNTEAITSAIRPISNIALVGDTDLAETADLVTNVMTAYNIPAGQMSSTADIMTRTFTRTNTTLMDLAESYKYAGSLMSLGGVDFATSSAALGIMGDAGIKGSTAGTSLRTILSNILNPRGKRRQEEWAKLDIKIKNDDGSLRGLNEIFGDIANKHLGVDSFYKLFDKTAAQAAAALALHVDKWNDVILDNLSSEGLAERLASEKKNTIQGLWAQLTSAISDIGLNSFENIAAPIKSMIVSGISFVRSDKGQQIMNGLFDSLLEFIEIIKRATKFFYWLWSGLGGTIKQIVKLQLVMWPLIHIVNTVRRFVLAFQLIPQTIGFLYSLSTWSRTLAVGLKTGGFRYGLDRIATAVTGGLWTPRTGPDAQQYPNGVPLQSSKPSGSILSSGSNGSGVSPVVGVGGRPIAADREMPNGRWKFWNKNRKAALFAGTVGLAGSAAGAYAGANVGEALGGSTGSIVGGIAGGVAGGAIATSVGSWLAGAAPALITNPVGWGVLAIAGVTAVAYGLVKLNQRASEANEASKKCAEALSQLSISTTDWGSENSVVQSNLRIMNNDLLDQRSKLLAVADAWDKAYAAMRGENKESFQLANTALATEIQELIDNSEDKWGRDELKDYFKGIFTAPNDLGLTYEKTKNGASLFTFPGYSQTLHANYTEDDLATLSVGFLAAQKGSDEASKFYNPKYTQIANAIENLAISSTNPERFMKDVGEKISQILPDVRKNSMRISREELIANKENYDWIAASEVYQKIITASSYDYANKWSGLIALKKNFIDGKSLDPASVKKLIISHVAPEFASIAHLFGTEDFQQYMVNYMHDAKGRSIEKNVARVQKMLQDLTYIYGLAPDSQKGIYSPFINKSYWEPMFPKDFQKGIKGGIEGLHIYKPNEYGYAPDNTKLKQKKIKNYLGEDEIIWVDALTGKTRYYDQNIAGFTRGTITPIAPTGVWDPISEYNEDTTFPAYWGNGSVSMRKKTIYNFSDNTPRFPTSNGEVFDFRTNKQLPNASSEAFKSIANYYTDKPVSTGNQVVITGPCTFNTNITPQGTTQEQAQAYADGIVNSVKTYAPQYG